MRRVLIATTVILIISTCFAGRAFAQILIDKQLSLIDKKTKFSSTPVAGGPAGTFEIASTFKNVSEDNLAELAFVVTRLNEGSVLLNADTGIKRDDDNARADGRAITGSVGNILTVPLAGDFSDGILAPGERFKVDFLIGVSSSHRFDVLVDPLGTILAGFAPTIDPAALTLGIPARVTVSAMITSSNPSLVPRKVRLLEVNEQGKKIRLLGTLNDKRRNGDRLAGDMIFSGEFNAGQFSTGVTRLRVSVAFRGISRHLKSEISTLEVLPPGVPTNIKPSNMAQAVLDRRTSGEIICNEVNVFFEPGTDVSIINQAIAQVKGRIVGLIAGPDLNTWQIRIPCDGAQGVHDAVSILDADPATEGAEPNAVLEPLGVTPNDPFFIQQYGLRRIEADKAWAITRGAFQGMTANPGAVPARVIKVIGIVDTGVDYNHEDLTGKVRLGRDWVNRDNDPMDDHGHGTFVAGIASALTANGKGISGTSWESRIFATKVAGRDGAGSATQVGNGILHAAANHASIINVSLSTPSRNETLAQAINFANDGGRLVVAAAGNDNCSRREYPAGFNDRETFSHFFGLDKNTYDTSVLAVGATDQQDRRWGAGNRSCIRDTGSHFGPWVDIYAPGVEIVSTGLNNSYVFGTGTSSAAPHVSGVAALVWSANLGLTARQVHNALTVGTGDPVGTAPDGTPIIRLNAFNAVFTRAAQFCPPPCELLALTNDISGPRRDENETQASAIHGLSVPLLPAQSYDVAFNLDLHTWDSYNATAGFWDSFSVSISPRPYWQLSLSDPLNGGDPLSLGFSWGGTQHGDGVLESNHGSSIATMLSTGTSNFLNIVLDTATLPEADHAFPSWGRIRITDITPRR